MSTETYDQRFAEIDKWPTKVALEAMLEGQLAAVASLYSQLDRIATAAEAAAARMRQGGRLVYIGAGTSGRIAVQDAVELPPTYGWPRERLLFMIAGGMSALASSVEGAEDDELAARAQIAAASVNAADVAIGVAASGTTKFTVAGIQCARERGALTIGIANNPETELLRAAEHAILADTGSEVVAGSTRMKAGTAQKAVLNLLSTAIMLRCGLVYRGLMVNMRASNEKLAHRARSIVQELAGVSAATAGEALRVGGNNIRKAVLIASGAHPDEADRMLADQNQDPTSILSTHRSGRT